GAGTPASSSVSLLLFTLLLFLGGLRLGVGIGRGRLLAAAQHPCDEDEQAGRHYRSAETADHRMFLQARPGIDRRLAVDAGSVRMSELVGVSRCSSSSRRPAPYRPRRG